MTDEVEYRWERFEIREMAILLKSIDAPWWIAGGLAIDLFLNHESRTHDDLDIVINREDQSQFIESLKGWDLRETNPPGVLNPLNGDIAALTANAIWCRENLNTPWRFEFLLAPFSHDEWIYRRTSEIRGPIDTFGWQTSEGIRVIAPEIQLLYKSKARRPKDEIDFENCLPILNANQKFWLKSAIKIEHGYSHPWYSLL